MHSRTEFFYYLPILHLLLIVLSFTHSFASMMQSFYFSESQDALVLQTHKFAVGALDMGNSESHDP